jgi:hypothetical protein
MGDGDAAGDPLDEPSFASGMAIDLSRGIVTQTSFVVSTQAIPPGDQGSST